MKPGRSTIALFVSVAALGVALVVLLDPRDATLEGDLGTPERPTAAPEPRHIEAPRAQALAPAQLAPPTRAPEREAQGHAASEDEAAVTASSAPSSRADRHAESALAWLRRVLPERYGELTAAEAAELVNLDLRGATITDEDLAHLAQFANLRDLSLRGTAITDAGLAHLARLDLAHLELRGTAITGEALHMLPTARMEALHLCDTRVAGADLARLPAMPGLKTLKLNFLQVDDAALEALDAYPALSHLELDRSLVTDRGLERILQLQPQLKRIELRNAGVSSQRIRELARDYPECEFVTDELPRGFRSGGG